MGFVYATLDQHNRVKIGRNGENSNRLHALQTGNADVLTEIWSYTDPAYGVIETWLHHKFYPWKYRSEWYSNGRAIVRALLIYCNFMIEKDLTDLVYDYCSPRTSAETLIDEMLDPITDPIETDIILKRAITELGLDPKKEIKKYFHS